MERGARGNPLDPSAAAFYPAAKVQFAVALHPQFYHRFPHPTLPPLPPTAGLAFPVPTAASARAAVLRMVPQYVDEPEVRAAMEMAVREQNAWLQQAGDGLQYVLPVSARNWGWPTTAGLAGGRGAIALPAAWAQLAAADLDEPSQGSILVLNSDPATSCATLGQIFEAFGAVKEVRVVPSKQHLKLVEFHDERDAAHALSDLNGKVIHGRRLVLELGSTGSQTRSLYYSNIATRCQSSLPSSLLRGSPKASRWIQSSGNGSKPVALLKSISINARDISEKKNRKINRSNIYSSPSSKQQQQRTSGGRGWKNHPKKDGDSRFLFKEGDPEESYPSDSRTTVMIRNIPNKYSQKLLLKMLDDHCMHCNEQIGDGDDEPYSAYDFVYLPIDFNNKCNVGYGFVNVTSPKAALRLYEAFHQQPWQAFISRKICQVTYARLQGLEALMEHFRRSKLQCDDDEYMPVTFSPPRDGKRLADPVPVVGGRQTATLIRRAADDTSRENNAAPGGAASSTTTSTHAPFDDRDSSEDEGGEDVIVGRGGDGGSGRDGTGSGLRLNKNCIP